MHTNQRARSGPEWGEHSNSVREYVRKRYLEPSRARGESQVRVVVGEVHRGLGLANRVPLVCNALKGSRFLQQNGLKLEKVEGPPSGLSTTVVYTFSFVSDSRKERHPLWSLQGVAKDLFREIGGGEAFLSDERKNFFGGT